MENEEKMFSFETDCRADPIKIGIVFGKDIESAKRNVRKFIKEKYDQIIDIEDIDIKNIDNKDKCVVLCVVDYVYD